MNQPTGADTPSVPRIIRILAVVVPSIAILGLLFSFLPGDAPSRYALETIERADTVEERMRGLSGREVSSDYGMLFVFPEEGTYGFWMKDMLSAIDIVWLTQEGEILGIEEYVAPESYPKVFYPPSPVRYVLEVKAGTAKERNWIPGNRLALPLE